MQSTSTCQWICIMIKVSSLERASFFLYFARELWLYLEALPRRPRLDLGRFIRDQYFNLRSSVYIDLLHLLMAIYSYKNQFARKCAVFFINFPRIIDVSLFVSEQDAVLRCICTMTGDYFHLRINNDVSAYITSSTCREQCTTI